MLDVLFSLSLHHQHQHHHYHHVRPGLSLEPICLDYLVSEHHRSSWLGLPNSGITDVLCSAFSMGAWNPISITYTLLNL